VRGVRGILVLAFGTSAAERRSPNSADSEPRLFTDDDVQWVLRVSITRMYICDKQASVDGDLSTANQPSEYNGQTYCVCAPSCKRQFLADPDAYSIA
jgi:YHS domain-containing protein